MRLNQSKRRNNKKKADKDALEKLDNYGVASVAIWNGERVTIENRELLEEIRLADDPVEKVSSLGVGDFADAGMEGLEDPLKEGPMTRFIKKYRERLASLLSKDSPEKDLTERKISEKNSPEQDV